MSSGSPIRCSAVLSAAIFWKSSKSTPMRSAVCCVIAVETNPGRDAVDVDVEAAELDRERLRHRLDAGLRGRVVQLAAVAERRDRGDQHHLPAAVLGHVRLRRLGREERAAQVGGDHGVPVVVGHLVDEVVADDPGAGDEDVEAAVLLDRPRDRAPRLRRGRSRRSRAAGPARRRRRRGRRPRPSRPRTRSARRRRLADPAAAAGDERDLPSKRSMPRSLFGRAREAHRDPLARPGRLSTRQPGRLLDVSGRNARRLAPRACSASARARCGTTWPRTSRSTTATSCGSRTGRRSAACGSSASGRRA